MNRADDNKPRRYFISEHLHRQVFHGGIGNVDAERILLERGYQPVTFPAHFDFSPGAKLRRLAYLIKIFFTIRAHSLVVFQFPVYARINKLLLRLLNYRGAAIICFIADIDGLKDGDALRLQKDKKELQRYSRFIVHNLKMKEWLVEVAPGSTIREIEFFDLLATPSVAQRTKTSNIAFAGNLEKSTFLEKLGKLGGGLRFILYGPGITGVMQAQSNAVYKGTHKAYELPQLLEGSFGLVWDGDSIDGCGGSLGKYMEYISHNKLSLYILAGMPVITAKQAASAYLVEKYGVGITVNNLHEIEPAINSISEEAYRRMRANMVPLATKISTGNCLGEALAFFENPLSL